MEAVEKMIFDRDVTGSSVRITWPTYYVRCIPECAGRAARRTRVVLVVVVVVVVVRAHLIVISNKVNTRRINTLDDTF